jgi:hypothetical protein
MFERDGWRVALAVRSVHQSGMQGAEPTTTEASTNARARGATELKRRQKTDDVLAPCATNTADANVGRMIALSSVAVGAAADGVCAVSVPVVVLF